MPRWTAAAQLADEVESVTAEMLYVSDKCRQHGFYSLAAKISSRAQELYGYAAVLLDENRKELPLEETAKTEERPDPADTVSTQTDLPF